MNEQIILRYINHKIIIKKDKKDANIDIYNNTIITSIIY